MLLDCSPILKNLLQAGRAFIVTHHCLKQSIDFSLERGECKVSGLGQLIAPKDAEAFTAIQPRVVKKAEDALFGEIRLEVRPRLPD